VVETRNDEEDHLESTQSVMPEKVDDADDLGENVELF